MRVFVTGTGRCGSVSFEAACRHFTNYRSGHETSCGLEYPDQHIEVSPHLRCCIPYLAAKYPGSLWVHLIREPQPCIDSLAALDHGYVMRAYAVLHSTALVGANPSDIAFWYYWWENDAIRTQLAALVAPQNRITLHLDRIKKDWERFTYWIGAQGDLGASLAAWDVRRNTREERGEHVAVDATPGA